MLLVLIVEESISSLKVTVMFADIETVFAPLEGEVEEIVGAVVSEAAGVGKLQVTNDATLFPALSVTPVRTTTV